jgi:hypothetical protein
MGMLSASCADREKNPVKIKDEPVINDLFKCKNFMEFIFKVLKLVKRIKFTYFLFELPRLRR